MPKLKQKSTSVSVAPKKSEKTTLNRTIKKKKDVVKKKEKDVIIKTLKNKKQIAESILKVKEEPSSTVVVKKKGKDVISKPLKNKKQTSKTVLKVEKESPTTLAVKKTKKNAAPVISKKEDKPQSPENKRKRKETTSEIPKNQKKKGPVVKSIQENVHILPVKKEQSEVSPKKEETPNGCPIKKKEMVHFVKILLKLIDSDEQKKRTLFGSDKPPVFLLVNCVKVPKVPLHQMRMILPHSMVSSNDDVALFVKDLKRGRRRDYEDTVQHYEDLLQKHNVDRIKTIIPINQVKTEYRQYEMRRRLLNSYDYFLTDGSISGHMAHLLGKEFREKRKLPTSIHMNGKDLKKEIDVALRKTSMQLHGNGDSYLVQVGSFSMTVEKIADNIISVVKDLSKDFPGGWNNIRSLRIKTPLSLAIPIYMTLKNKNDVEVPVIAPKRPKAHKLVEGELTTLTSNVKVSVAPDGTLNVIKLDNETDENKKDPKEENKENEEKNEEDDEDEDGDEDGDEDEDEEDDS